MSIKYRVKKLASRLLGSRLMPNGHEPYAALRAMPRYTKGVCKLAGRRIEFPDGPSFAAMYDEIFRNEIYRFVSDSANPFVIDCGANIGISILYFKQVYPACRILAFEPDPAIFTYLSKNISR